MTVIQTLNAERGDTAKFTVTVKNAAGTAVLNLTQCAIWFTVKDANDRATDDTNALVSLSWKDSPREENGIIVADVTTGIASIVVPAATMANLRETASYVWDLQVMDSTPEVDTPLKGPFVVTNDVTIRTTVP